MTGPAGQPAGASAASLARAAREGTVGLPAFLAETCLSYCEFYELWQSGFVAFRNGRTQEGDGRNDGSFPECEPCCPDELWLSSGAGQQQQGLADLLVFVRLWRKLRDSRCGGYSFAQLRDICDVLQLISGGALNPDFVRQLAAFQMLREEFGLELTDPAATCRPARSTRTGRNCWRCGRAGAAAWPWAVRQLHRAGGTVCARRHHRCDPRSRNSSSCWSSNLDPLSRLAGFDPASATDSWHALPTHTLRFAEVLCEGLRVRLQRRRADLPVHRGPAPGR